VSESLHKLGDVLRAAREAKGIDLARVERETKIRTRYLSALEHGDYAELPGAVYTKGFLRNYGTFLGLDPEYLVDLYHLETDGAVAKRPSPGPPRPLRVRRARAFVVTPGAIAAAILTVAVVAFVGYLAYEFVTFARTPTLALTQPTGDVPRYHEMTYTIVGVTVPNATVTVDGPRLSQDVTADGEGQFHLKVSLVPGANLFTIVANDPVTHRDSVTKTVTIDVDLSSPSPSPGAAVAIAAPEDGGSLSGPVTVKGTAPAGTAIHVEARLTTAADPGFTITSLSGQKVAVPAPKSGDVVSADATADAASGNHSYAERYPSDEAAAARLASIAAHASAALRALPDGAHHATVLAAMAWAAGRPLRGAAAAAAGVAAGVGLALKPHLLAPAVLVEAYLAWRQPSQRAWRRPEVLAIAVVVLAYGSAVAVWTPEYFAVAELVARLYGGLNPPALTLLRVPEVPLWGFAALLLVLTRLPVDSRPAWTVLFLAATGFLVAALAQMKGWEYHLYPAEVTLLFLVVAAIFWVLDALGSLPAVLAGGTRSIVVLLAAALLVSTGRQTMRDRQPDSRDLVTPLHAIVEQYAHGRPIYVMGMLVYPAFPLVNVSGLEWSSRHNSLWFLQGLYREELARPGEFRFRTPAEMPALEGEFYEEIITDLCSRPPAVLIVESLTHYGPGGRRPFDVLAYYRQDPRFEHLFSAYRPVGQVDAFRAYVSSGDASCTLDESRLVRERGLDHRQRISSPAASPTAAVADTTVRFGYASSTS